MTAVDVADRPAPPSDEQLDDEVEESSPPDLAAAGPRFPRLRWRRPEAVNWPEAIITVVLVAFLTGFVVKYLQPSKLFLNTTPAGGDMGAHVWQGYYLKDHLLTHFRLTGWAPDWYAGFPSLVFYFPLPFLMMAIVNIVVPYNVAFKLITVLGLVTLPLAAYIFGRLARFRFPGPVCLAAATVPYLFSTNFTIYGGNIASTMAGEFGFSIGLSAALIFLGLVARGLETGKYRALAAVMLVVTGMCHLLPGIFALCGALVLTVMRWDRRSWRWILPVLGVAAGLAAFWWMPFLLRLPYATNMGYQKITQYLPNLLPKGEVWLPILAALGAVVSLLRRQKLGMFVTIMATLSLLIFRYAPQARLWNARVLPFWFLCLYLLAGIAVAEGGAALLEPLKPGPVPNWSRRATLALPVVTAAAVWILVGFPLHGLPGGSVNTKTNKYHWLGFSSADTSFIPSWVDWNYSGYQSSGKSRMAEYFGLVNTMAKLGKTDGCGRAMWEYEPELDQMGTPDALMLLPYWTSSCIGSMEGLYYESSATTPYHFINAAELSLQPSDPVRGLNYPASPDVAEGVQHLQLLGVKYYMALTPQTQEQADADPDLRLVATSGPWPESYSTGPATGVTQRTWKIYEVANSQIVAPLINQPVVMKGIAKGGQPWLTASMDWYLNPNVSDVMYAASGPSSWARVSPTSANPPRTSLQPVQVSDITSNDSSVSFNVDTVGVPVLVKVSYFPNWQAHGAKGPYRVAPNLMVVIPTSHHVWLHYGNTPIDWIGYLFGVIGLIALVWLFRADPVTYASAGGGLGGPVIPPADSGLADAYGRLQRELAAVGGRPEPPGGAGWTAADDLDAWLGFPAGLGGSPPRGGDVAPVDPYDPAQAPPRGGALGDPDDPGRAPPPRPLGSYGSASPPMPGVVPPAGIDRLMAPRPPGEPVAGESPDDDVVWLGSPGGQSSETGVDRPDTAGSVAPIEGGTGETGESAPT